MSQSSSVIAVYTVTSCYSVLSRGQPIMGENRVGFNTNKHGGFLC